MNKPLLIMGTGGFAREVGFLIRDLGLEAQWGGFLDVGAEAKELMGRPIWPVSYFHPDKYRMVMGIGSPQIREKIVADLPPETEYATLIHPSASCNESIEIGSGTIICAGCILTCDIRIGAHVHLNIQTTVGHDAVIEDFVTTAPSVNINGNCSVRKGAYLGTKVAMKQGTEIGPGVRVGMGAIVVNDLLEPGTYVGVPARKKES
ncbi:MAG: NeuD/PglB/VioB family sugar acetyltransferase [Bacteroidota bacterium]